MAFSHGSILTVDEVNLENNTVTVTTKKCVVCGQNSTMTIDRTGFNKWQEDTHIQEAFPDMSAGDRETLISGTHDKCWNVLWANE